MSIIVISSLSNCYLETGNISRRLGKVRNRAKLENKIIYLTLTDRRNRIMNVHYVNRTLIGRLAPEFQIKLFKTCMIVDVLFYLVNCDPIYEASNFLCRLTYILLRGR